MAIISTEIELASDHVSPLIRIIETSLSCELLRQ